MHLLSLIVINKKKYIQESIKVTLDLENILSQDIICPDAIIANDWDGLALASILKSEKNWHSKIYFDAHEYAPKQRRSMRWKLVIKPIIIDVLKKCRENITIMSTVCDGIAREYEHFLKFPSNSIEVVTNACDFRADLSPIELQKNQIRLIHHGGAIKERRIELMIKMMKYLDPDKYSLTLILVRNEPKYYEYLVNLSRKYKNISFIDPVEFSKITRTLNCYDIGVYILNPTNFNQEYALPNKLFEFVQARLAIAIGPSVEMKKIVDSYNLGVYSKSFSPKSLAYSISQISSEKLFEYKKNADKYAKELSADENLIKIQKIIGNCISV
jgi:glycosyltransferase involved in cell wall biosynthesis